MTFLTPTSGFQSLSRSPVAWGLGGGSVGPSCWSIPRREAQCGASSPGGRLSPRAGSCRLASSGVSHRPRTSPTACAGLCSHSQHPLPGAAVPGRAGKLGTSVRRWPLLSDFFPFHGRALNICPVLLLVSKSRFDAEKVSRCSLSPGRADRRHRNPDQLWRAGARASLGRQPRRARCGPGTSPSNRENSPSPSQV